MTDPIHPASGDLEAHRTVSGIILDFCCEMHVDIPVETHDALATIILAALRPANPPATAAGTGEDGPEVGSDAVGLILAPYLSLINENPALLSILYDADMMPETATRVRDAIAIAAVCEAYKATPASHDALIARVREVLKRTRRYVADMPIVGDEDTAAIDALLADLDARAGR